MKYLTEENWVYSLKQNGWCKGEPEMCNDFWIVVNGRSEKENNEMAQRLSDFLNEDAQQDTAEETETAGNKQGTAIAKIAADLLRGIMARTLFSAESQASIVSEFQRQLSSVA